MQELLAAAVEYGNEILDAEVRHDNVDVTYMDLQGVERRVGAKTNFEDVRGARVLRLTKRAPGAHGLVGADEKGGLVSQGMTRKKRAGAERRVKKTRLHAGADANGGGATEASPRVPGELSPHADLEQPSAQHAGAAVLNQFLHFDAPPEGAAAATLADPPAARAPPVAEASLSPAKP